MKKINKYIILGLGVLAFTSCESLDTKFLGGAVTGDQKEGVLEQNPEMASAAVTACSATFNRVGYVYGEDYHFDFGYPAVMLGLDLQTNDMVCFNSGYNWFSDWEAYSTPNAQGRATGMMWYTTYDQIFSANNVAATIPSDTEDGQLKFFRAQALAYRAFDYWLLAQLYQFNYVGNETKPCVPLITDENAEEAATNGAPRATVQEVYEQVLSDLNEAIALLSSTSVTAAQVIDSKPKRLISLATAYGLRARAYLSMHEYAKAAQDAQSAIASFSGAPYSMQAVSQPTFASLDDAAWMWGIAVAETDRAVTSGILNWPSMVCTFCGNGYVTVGAWKFANVNLYNAIASSDVRKGWFLDANCQSKNLSAAQQAYITDNYSPDVTDAPIDPYTNVKFNSYQGVIGQSTNSNDIPMMRIEEMYYILAEGQVMSGNVQGGLDTFANFVKTYRNPGVIVESGLTAEQAQNMIYQDRRVEFWGEGLAYFDMMRLGIAVDRVGANWPAAYVYQIPCNPEEGPQRIYCIPQGEINGNPALSDADNNPSSSQPPVIR